jgi:hypothetical protein
MTAARDTIARRSAELIEIYRQGASRHGRASNAGLSARVINRAYRQLDRALQELRELDPDWHRAMMPLLDDEDCHVRLWAAVHLHEVEPERTRAAVEELAAGSSEAAFDAKMLKKWDSKWA